MDLEKLRRAGALLEEAGVAKGVRVSLHYQPKLTAPTIETRRRELMSCIDAALSDASVKDHVVVDPDSASVLAQTVSAVLPVEQLEATRSALSQLEIRTDVLARRQVVPA